MSNNTNAIGSHASSDSILSESTQSWQELSNSTQSCPKSFKLTQTYSSFLNAKHQADIQARGIFPKWAAANCMTCDIPKASLVLDYKAYSPGIMLMSDCYGQWQFRPDDPWHSKGKEDKDPPKYRTPKHEYDLFLAKHPDIQAYWEDLEALKARCFTINGKPYLLLTEGGFKAIIGCQNGIPTVAVAGVTMGLTPKAKGEPDLVPALKRLAEAGFNFIIAFDSDHPDKTETLKNVRYHEAKLAKVLKSYGCDVLSVTGKWSHEDGKGMDDFIQNKEIQAFREILMKANAEVETADTSDSPAKAKKPPTPQEITARLAEEFGHELKYDEEQQTWRKWSRKHWEKIGLGAFRSWLKKTLDGKGVKYGGSAYLEDVRKLLECDLRQLKWQFWEKSRYINFSNCVFDGAQAKTLNHSPGMGFTSFLPYEYKPLTGELGDSLEALCVNCPNIYQFFYEAMKGDKRKMFKLLAIINALLKHRFFDLQMFVHLVGKPGSGKGKFARLCEKLVGESNYIGCQLDRLTDGSTKASIIDKQLVVFPDERKPVGVDSILSLTGGDIISYRELHTPAASAYFYGTIMICSNKPIFVGDTTGLERRLCLVGFDNPIPDDKRDHSLEAELDSEIPACIAIALSLADKTVTQAIRGKGTDQIIEFKRKEWEMKVESDSIAAFFDMALISDPTAETRTGELFEAYTAFCTEGGMSRIKLPKFGGMLADILAGEKLPFTRKQGARASFVGLRLRTDTDTQPTHSEVLAGIVGVCEGVGGGLEGVCEGFKPLPNIELRELRGFDSKLCVEKTNEKDFLPDEEESDREINLPLSTPSTPSNAEPVKDTILSSTPSQPPLNPLSTEIEKPLTLADEMKNALASADREAARKIWTQVKGDKTAQENLKSQLTEDENTNVRLLLNCGFVKGLRVKYVGQKFAEQFEGMELMIDDIDSHHGVCCKKPDGSWTAYLNKADWQKI
ncbi:DUF3854 domain-containing protein [Microcoleus sp. MON1_C1]|uniref:DUF3854 domain-containing protein n=1 Tax=Microcoleus sp. MON1_C1 TaxID=2818827 RepID=UPI002FD1046D